MQISRRIAAVCCRHRKTDVFKQNAAAKSIGGDSIRPPASIHSTAHFTRRIVGGKEWVEIVPRGVANSKQLAMMTKVLDDYCAAHRIDDPAVHQDMGALLLRLFDRGARSREELAAALEDHFKKTGSSMKAR